MFTTGKDESWEIHTRMGRTSELQTQKFGSSFVLDKFHLKCSLKKEPTPFEAPFKGIQGLVEKIIKAW